MFDSDWSHLNANHTATEAQQHTLRQGDCWPIKNRDADGSIVMWLDEPAPRDGSVRCTTAENRRIPRIERKKKKGGKREAPSTKPTNRPIAPPNTVHPVSLAISQFPPTARIAPSIAHWRQPALQHIHKINRTGGGGRLTAAIQECGTGRRPAHSCRGGGESGRLLGQPF